MAPTTGAPGHFRHDWLFVAIFVMFAGISGTPYGTGARSRGW